MPWGGGQKEREETGGVGRAEKDFSILETETNQTRSNPDQEQTWKMGYKI